MRVHQCLTCGKFGRFKKERCHACLSSDLVQCKHEGCRAAIPSSWRSGYCRTHIKLHSPAYIQSQEDKRSLNNIYAARDKALNATGRWVTCHNSKRIKSPCQNRFRLEWWQHPQMAWCPECRKSDEYQSFGQFLVVTRAGYVEARV